jgi:hypothetical protein
MLGRGKLPGICSRCQSGARVDEDDLSPGLLEQWQKPLRKQQWAPDIRAILLVERRQGRLVQPPMINHAGTMHEYIQPRMPFGDPIPKRFYLLVLG